MKSFFMLALGWFCVLAGQRSLLAAGRQLAGQHAPASTPALSPAEAQKKFTVPPGFEMRLFAAEPDVVNPVAMTWDERGRLWVVELYEYPLGAPAGAKPRDNIKILEDTDGDGRADKVKTFADGLNLATGILLGHGGVYVGQAPHLLFLEDTNGDDLADKKTILMTGFGLQDRHELLNSFTWGPDGLLYMTHGVFTHSKVKDPKNPDDDGVIMNAAVARFDPRTRKFEVYADGTSNPWGVDFDRYGNAFVSACVIDHLFHLAPGGVYVRQGGTPAHPYIYQLLPSIVDHKHHMAAYSGVQVYQGDQYPEEYRGTIFMGNIHDNAVHQDRLIPNGSSFKASFIRDLVRANDGWFMPVSQQVGPDGALWIMDWYDKYPCYQNANADPEGVDREHGRVWRLVYTGNKPGAPVPPRPIGMNLAKLNSAELVQTLALPSVWQRRMAQRLLTERRDVSTKPPLQKLLRDGQTLEARLAALWTLHSSGLLDDATLDNLVAGRETGLRMWAARLTGERGDAAEQAIQRLTALAADPEPTVRLAVAVAARQFVSGSLTVNTPIPAALAGAHVEEILTLLVQNSSSAEDPVLPFMIWMAAEPGIARDPEPAFGWLSAHGAETMPLSGQLLRKIMLRVCDAGKTEFLDAAVSFLSGLGEQDAAMAVAGLDGLIEGQRGKALAPGVATGPLLSQLRASANPELVERSQRLGTLWGDAAALREVLNKAADPKAGEADRIKAIQVARQMKNDAAREAMLELLARNSPDTIAIEALRALGELGGDSVAEAILDRWRTYSAMVRRAAAETLVSRNNWTRAFLSALERKEVATADLPVPVVRTLTQSKDDSIRSRAAKAIGRFRETEADKLKLIAEKKKVVINGPVDLAAGHEVAQKTCFTCHKLYGEGAEVGPELTGVGRSSLDALLANVIDPNQIIGKGYENVEVETKDGRSVSGRLVEEAETRIKLLAAGPKEEVIAKSDIASIRVSELSVMPEGLEQMPEGDFRNLIWFILNPPGDNRPLTPQLRKELIGEEKPKPPSSTQLLAPDGESVSLWNPSWRINAPEFEGSPMKLPEYAGRKNVLMTHPIDRQKGAALERTVALPAGKKATLSVGVAAHEEGDWELRVLADGQLLKEQTVDKAGGRWQQVQVDLSPFAGQKIALRLENCANNWEYEFGYWADLELQIAER